MRYNTYKFLTSALSPAVYWWLRLRLVRGKEDKERFRERLGISTATRPEGVLVWLHAASVGEVVSVIPMIEEMQTRFPDVKILLTTGTVTSAKLVASRNLKNIIHQYIPVDTPEAVNRFFRRFRPDIGFWVESELWPNLVVTARARGCFMIIANGRMSQRSFDKWQKHGLNLIYQMMQCFEVVFAQTEDDAQRFRALGARDVRYAGNIKYDGSPLTCNEAELFALRGDIKNRPVWLAASTHDGEEEKIAQAHAEIKKTYPGALTIIAPRHPQRGEEIASKLSKYGRVSLRSRGEKITGQTDFYVADTLGELGLFYRLCDIVFMGGSFVPRGGHNPIEPIRLRCCVLTGGHTENFADMFASMEKFGICERVNSPQELAVKVVNLLGNSDEIVKRQAIAKEWLKENSGAISRMLTILAPIFAPVE